MFKKFQLIAQIVGCLTLAFLAIFGLLTLLRADPARALGLEPAAAQAVLVQPKEVPQTMNYQGTLRDSAGELLTGAYTMTLRLYANVTDPLGSALWSEEHTGVVVREGAFDVVLGDITPLAPSLFSASEHRYLKNNKRQTYQSSLFHNSSSPPSFSLIFLSRSSNEYGLII